MIEDKKAPLKFKVTICSLAVALCGFLFFLLGGRWTDTSKGFPSDGPDYGSMIVITHEIEAGRYFPGLNFSELGPHSIGKYLPIYHGIWGAPLLTIFFEKIFSVPTPQAMLIVGDISIVLSLIIFLQILMIYRVSSYGVLALMPLFMINVLYMLMWGHYQNLLAVLCGLILWRWKDSFTIWWSYGLVFLATICYPDSFLVLAPFLLLKKSDSRSQRRWQLGVIGLIYSVLIFTLVSRFHLQASIDLNWWAYGLGACLTAFVIFKRRASAVSDFSWNYFGVTLLVLGISIALNGKVVYYATKIIYWAPLVLIDLLSAQEARYKKRIEQILLVAASLAILWYAPDLRSTLEPLFTATSSYSGSEERHARQLLSENPNCPDGIVLPVFKEDGWSSAYFVKTIAMASLTGRMNINTGKVNLDDFGVPHVPMLDFNRHLSAAILTKGLKKDGIENIRFYCPHH